MSRVFDNKQSLQQKIIKGANILADNVASTLGPRGRNVLLQEKNQQPFITKDGVTVAAFVSLDDPFENAGAQIIRQAASQKHKNLLHLACRLSNCREALRMQYNKLLII